MWYAIPMWYYLFNNIVITLKYQYAFGSGCFRRVPIVLAVEKSPNIAMCGRGTLQKSMAKHALSISHEKIRSLMYFNYLKQYGRTDD